MNRTFIIGKIGMIIGSTLANGKSISSIAFGTTLSDCTREEIDAMPPELKDQIISSKLRYDHLGNYNGIVVKIGETRIYIFPRQDEDRKITFVVADTFQGNELDILNWSGLETRLVSVLYEFQH